MLISRLFARVHDVAAADPGRIALVGDGDALDYGQFVRVYTAIAERLLATGACGEGRVGVFIGNSCLAYAVIYACMHRDLTFVPLPIRDPPARLCEIIGDARLDVLVCAQAQGEDARRLIDRLERQPHLLTINPADYASWLRERLEPSLSEPFPRTRPVYMLFTSGSTGRPKGVSIGEASLDNFFAWAERYLDVTPADVFLAHSQLTFDLSVFNVVLPLHCGASVLLAETPAQQIYPGELFERGATIALIVPRVTTHLMEVDELTPSTCRTLRHVLFCGEHLLPKFVNTWLAQKPDLQLHNLYGPTEATIACTAHRITEHVDEGNAVPIGVALPHTTISLIDHEGNEVHGQGVGEMIISGVPVSRYGYWRHADPRFFEHPRHGRSFKSGDLARRDAQGLLYWLARIDDQVKIRGVRVEVSEVEIRLSSHPQVRELACVFDPEREMLFLFLSVRANADAARVIAELRAACVAQLPHYMHPVEYRALPEIPKNRHGKTDKHLLKTWANIA